METCVKKEWNVSSIMKSVHDFVPYCFINKIVFQINSPLPFYFWQSKIEKIDRQKSFETSKPFSRKSVCEKILIFFGRQFSSNVKGGFLLKSGHATFLE